VSNVTTMWAKWIVSVFIFAALFRPGKNLPKCANPLAQIDTFSTIFKSHNNLLFWDKVNNLARFPVNIRHPVMLYTSLNR